MSAKKDRPTSRQEDAPALVRAAGGVVWREAGGGRREVVLVHRPKYDDWTLPKGKAEPGESDEDCARREVREETGLVCRLGDELASTSYIDPKGRPKVVRYWAMEPTGGELRRAGDDEIGAAVWLGVAEALERLSYDHDRALVRAL